MVNFVKRVLGVKRKTHKFVITETRVRFVEIDEEDFYAAEERVHDRYNDGQIVLQQEDICEWTIKPIGPKRVL